MTSSLYTLLILFNYVAMAMPDGAGNNRPYYRTIPTAGRRQGESESTPPPRIERGHDPFPAMDSQLYRGITLPINLKNYNYKLVLNENSKQLELHILTKKGEPIPFYQIITKKFPELRQTLEQTHKSVPFTIPVEIIIRDNAHLSITNLEFEKISRDTLSKYMNTKKNIKKFEKVVTSKIKEFSNEDELRFVSVPGLDGLEYPSKLIPSKNTAAQILRLIRKALPEAQAIVV